MNEKLMNCIYDAIQQAVNDGSFCLQCNSLAMVADEKTKQLSVFIEIVDDDEQEHEFELVIKQEHNNDK